MDDKNLKDAQYRKGMSIAFFNATNAAIELYKATIEVATKNLSLKEVSGVMIDEKARKFIVDWRDWFLVEHAEYYGKVISNIGANYNSEKSIEKLQNTASLDELRQAWIDLSEDERRDGSIIAKLSELKKKYENASNATA